LRPTPLPGVVGLEPLLTSAGEKKARTGPVPAAKRHQLTLKNRERLSVEGVTHVDSFDRQEVVLQTEGGVLHVKGEGLNVRELNVEAATLTVEGHIRSLEYAEAS